MAKRLDKDHEHPEFSGDSEILDSSLSLSHLSEPPDIRNWFSSYVYESPVLDSKDGFICSASEESCGDVEDSNVDESNPNVKKEEKFGIFGTIKRNCDLGIDENGVSDAFGQSAENNEKFQGKHLEVSDDVVLEKISENENHILQEGKTTNHDVYPRKSVKNAGVSELDQNYGMEKLLMKDGIVEDYSGPSDKNSIEREQERKLAALAEKGFVSTRKNKRINDENSGRSTITPSGCSKKIKNMSTTNQNFPFQRSALLETTNFEHHEALDTTGKWRCPQKSKPCLGPPLKQLRLGQWVRRV